MSTRPAIAVLALVLCSSHALLAQVPPPPVPIGLPIAAAPGGKYAIGIGGIASVDTRAETPVSGPDGARIGSKMPLLGGTGTVCVWDVATGAILYSWEPSKMEFNTAKDPAISPDGKLLAMACGQFSLEHLAVGSFADLLAGRPGMRVIVAGQRILPSAATMGKTGNTGCTNPAWSPDGKRIVFLRMWFGEICAGNLWIVDADGSNLRQLTDLGQQGLALSPCFSPDGTQVAFTLITPKQGYIQPEKLLALDVNANVCRLDLATGRIIALTTDNVSSDPAWGP